MAAPKRTRQQRLADRAKMVKLIRKGYSQKRIAEELGICQQQVSYDWKIVQNELKDNVSKDHRAIVAAKLSELEEIKQEAWKAYEKSKDPAKKRVVEEKEVPTEQGILTLLKKTRTMEGRDGDATHLGVVLSAIRQEREILGLDPAKKVDMTSVSAEVDWDELAKPEATTDPVEAKVKELEERLRTRLSEESPPPVE